MNTIINKKIAIVGGGPGGLTLARLLQRSGATVNVYERDLNRNVRVQGATLDLHDESGLKAIQKAGLMDAFKANFRPGADRLRIMDKGATVVFDQHEDTGDATFGDDTFRPEIDRGPLRAILLDSLKPDTVVWNSYLLNLTPIDDSWKLEFQNDTSVVADVVIAADGANSKIRPLITSIKPFYSGVTIVEGSVYQAETAVPELNQLVNGGKIFAFGNEKSIIVSSKGDGSLVFYTGCKTEEHWNRESTVNFADKAQVINWFKEEFAGWGPIWLTLFENAELPLTVRPQYCMPLDQSWETQPNLTMLGDAAHLMPPYAGEGVNMAMLDALELSECLTSDTFPDTHSALAAYEKQMLSRASETAKLTLEQTDALHAPDAIAHILAVIS
ncbi:NAD(P)/FAD-dependent oxidoreductase [Spirosoma flavus]